MSIFRKSLLCAVFVLLGLAMCLQAQTIHVMTVADLRSFTGSAATGIKKDVENIKKFFQGSVPASKLRFYEVDPYMATPNAIREKILAVNVEPDDTFVFYYTGHAGNDPTSHGHYFQLKNEDNNPEALDRVEVRKMMHEKGCRLVVLLTDCCNKFDDKAFLGFTLGSTRSSVKDFSPLAKVLFVEPKGIADVTSAKIGQPSWAFSEGSIFTIAWVKAAIELNEKAKKGERVRWHEMVTRVTELSAEIFKKQWPEGIQGYRNQVPHAYEYPDKPPRFGARYMTLPEGNCQITEIKKDEAADKAGLKVGDLILEINGVEVLDEPEVGIAIDKSPSDCKIKIKRGEKELTLDVKLVGEPCIVNVEPDPRRNHGDGGTTDPKPRPNPDGGVTGDGNPKPNGGNNPTPGKDDPNPGSGPGPVVVQPPVEEKPAFDPNGPMFGADVPTNSNVIKKVVPKSPAEVAGLAEGDKIILFNDSVITNGKEFGAAVDASPEFATLKVQKKGSTTAIEIKMQLNIKKATSNATKVEKPTTQSATSILVDKPAETKPAETKPAETKPAETKPVETKPVETKPVETKPVETKPVETKPVETKPVETKPVETNQLPPVTKPVTEAGTISNNNPKKPSKGPIFGASMEKNSNKIVAVAQGGPAANIGIEVGDKITRFNGEEIKTGADFDTAVDKSPKTAEITVVNYRDGKETNVVIPLNK